MPGLVGSKLFAMVSAKLARKAPAGVLGRLTGGPPWGDLLRSYLLGHCQNSLEGVC